VRDTANIAAGRPPIEGYYEMNVEEIAERLDSFVRSCVCA
jgi:hypothetical protein